MIELLVVPDCPNEGPARKALAEAIGLAGIGRVSATITVIRSAEEAFRRGFVGSPTFLIDGVDPFAVAGALPGMSCRVYTTPGGLAGVPDVESLRDALKV